MQLIEAALAFAITMLALSLVVSSFVEIIHRICSMREEGLKHVLRQMFDQVLAKHVVDPALLKARDGNLAEADRKAAEAAIIAARNDFVVRMSANRAPMGAAPRATPTTQTGNIDS
jgi:outer membrane protein TolC